MKYTQTYINFLKELDSQEYTPENDGLKIKGVCEKHHEIVKNDTTDLYKYFLLEKENIHITKSVAEGFSPMISGTKKTIKEKMLNIFGLILMNMIVNLTIIFYTDFKIQKITI